MKEVLKQIEKTIKYLLENPEECRKFFIKYKLYTPSGELTKPYIYQRAQKQGTQDGDKKKFDDYKTELLDYIEAQSGEQITEALADGILAKKQEFLDYLRQRGLDALLDPSFTKSEYEWDCMLSIQDILMNFDMLLYQTMDDDLKAHREYVWSNKIKDFDISLKRDKIVDF